MIQKSPLTYLFCLRHVWFSFGFINIVAWAFFIIAPMYGMITQYPNHMMGIWGPITVAGFFFLIPIVVMIQARARTNSDV